MDLNYKKSDFENLYVNVNEVPKGKSVLKAFPELSRIEEFSEDLDELNLERDLIIKYIVLVYDPKTPLPTELVKKKQEAAYIVGWRANKKGEYHKKIVKIFSCKNKVVNKMIIKYCINISPKYALYVSGLEAYEGILKDLISGDSSTSDRVKASSAKSDLFAKSETMSNKLTSIKDQLLAKDRAPELEESLYTIIAKKEKLRLRPEHRVDGKK